MFSVRDVDTNQQGIHEDLDLLVEKYRARHWQKPIATHTQQAAESVFEWLGNDECDIILDACCGVGESTINIAKAYPNAKVIGVDKSSARLDKHQHYQRQYSYEVSNALVVQADLLDFWRLLVSKVEEMHQWHVLKQYLLYPNPYPKKTQVTKRWHASPVFPFVMALSTNIEVRSNWKTYLEEFRRAAKHYNVEMQIECLNGTPITPFERKYMKSGQTCFVAKSTAAMAD